MISQNIVFIWRGVGIAYVSASNVHVYDEYAAVVDFRQRTASSLLVIKPKVLNEALQWRSHRRVEVQSYVNQTEHANRIYNAIYFTFVERHFRSKNHAHSHGGVLWGSAPHDFFGSLPHLLCPEIFVLNI